MATRSCCSTPRTAVAGGRSATSAPAPCRSTKRSSASATIHTSWNCARLTIEPRQRIDTQSEGRSLETTGLLIEFLESQPDLPGAGGLEVAAGEAVDGRALAGGEAALIPEPGVTGSLQF